MIRGGDVDGYKRRGYGRGGGRGGWSGEEEEDDDDG